MGVKMRIKTRVKHSAILCILPFIVACSASRQQFEQQRLHQLKGESESQVIHLLGKPNQTLINDGVTTLIYQTSYKNYTPAPQQIYLNAGANLQGTFTKSECVTTFYIQEGIVTDVKTIGHCL